MLRVQDRQVKWTAAKILQDFRMSSFAPPGACGNAGASKPRERRSLSLAASGGVEGCGTGSARGSGAGERECEGKEGGEGGCAQMERKRQKLIRKKDTLLPVSYTHLTLPTT